jgi:NTE family protein
MEIRPTRERLNRLWRSTSALLDRRSTGAAPFDIAEIEGEEVDGEFGDSERGAPIPKLRSFAVMMRSIDIAQAALARHQMAAYPPDILIEVPRTACRSLDFHRAAELINLGHELAARALDRLSADHDTP